MPQFTFSWKAPTGESLFGQGWEPSPPVRAVMCLVHGHGEYSGRYTEVADRLNERGTAVISFDLLGHGKSGGKRGHTPSYEAMMDQIAQLIEEAKRRYPDKPIFLFGHSMGGNFAVNYAIRRKPEISGLILSAPWLRLAFEPSKFDLFLAKIMVNLYPSFTQSTKLDARNISSLAEEVERYSNDPLIHDMMSPVLFLRTVDAGIYALEHADQLALPTLIMHGSGDKITDFHASKELAEKRPDLVTFTPWEDLYHEMHHEAEREEVIRALAEWMRNRMQTV